MPRRRCASRERRATKRSTALEDLRALDLQRHSHEPLLDRAWALRDKVSADDAMYIALAEALGATLITCDARLPRVKGVNARMQLVT